MKKAIRTIALLICLVLSLCFFWNALAFEHVDGTRVLEAFYEQPDNSIDVLFVGSSHIFENVNTGVLWREYGISSFDFAGSAQPIYNSYYYLIEALKTQLPEVVVLDLYGVGISDDYEPHYTSIKNTYGFKPSKNALDNFKVSYSKTDLRYEILEYPEFHARYAEIGESDFGGYDKTEVGPDWKGYVANPFITALEVPEYLDSDECGELYPKAEEYYRMFIEYCLDKDIPLVVIVAPYQATKESVLKFNQAEKIAKEYGVPILDYNKTYEEIGIDFATDFADEGHLNWIGNTKFTSDLGKYLTANYKLTDHRGDDAYDSYERLANQLLLEEKELNETYHVQ